MLTFMPSNLLNPTFLFLLLSFIHHVWSLGIEFTSPAGGATLPAGPITITWSDGGGSPDMSALQTYTLELMVGGVNPDDSLAIHTIGASGALVSEGSVSGTIPAAVAQSIQNGFYFRMISNTSDDNVVLNYSDRFTLINMNGTTENTYLQAANAAAGRIDNVPPAQYNVIVATRPSSSVASVPSTATSDSPQSTTTETGTISSTPLSKGSVQGMSGMTKGLIIMSGILAVIGAISIIIWIIFCCRRVRRKREEVKPKEKPDDPLASGNKTELAAYRSSRAVDIPITPLEMAGQRERQELSGHSKAIGARPQSVVYELEGDMSAWEAGSGRRSHAWEAV